MSRLDNVRANRRQRKLRTRAALLKPEPRLRLSVHISGKHIRAQVIDDQKSTTLVAASTLKGDWQGTLSEKASAIGQEIAKNCQKAKIKTVVFDRGQRAYHGRLKNLAEAARKGGLEF